MFLNDFCLEIAKYTVRFFTKEDASIYIPEGYVPFLNANYKKPDVEIEVVQNIPFIPAKGVEVFNAYEPAESNNSDSPNALWNIVEYDDQKLDYLQQRAQKR